MAGLSLPDSRKKLETRLKCNLYYYRANYLVILSVSLLVSFIWRPSSLLAVATGVLGILCLNNTFAISLRYQTLPCKLLPFDGGKLQSERRATHMYHLL